MRIDGYTNEFTDGERIFSYNPTVEAPEEASDDSKWGINNDLNQIRITWDAHYLYLAGEGRIWDNNMILFIDSVPGRGLARMDSLNSWRRNFFFDTTSTPGVPGFAPDLFGATWDTNTSPHLIVQLQGQTVDDEVVGPLFNAAATFDQGNPGRAMELAIPWSSVFVAQAGVGTRDTVMSVRLPSGDVVRDTFPLFPPGTKIRICGAITGGADGTGGPDLAPDNTRGLSSDGGAAVYVDNWAIIDLDQNDDTGTGHGGPDGVADWGVEPVTRVSFRYRPPLFPLRFCVGDLVLDRPAFRPDLGERLNFSLHLDPPPDPSDPQSELRTVILSANVFDLHGRFVRNLYVSQTRPVLAPNDPAFDVWDGRDSQGRIVPAGIYALRSVVEPNLCRATRAFVVAR